MIRSNCSNVNVKNVVVVSSYILLYSVLDYVNIYNAASVFYALMIAMVYRDQVEGRTSASCKKV